MRPSHFTVASTIGLARRLTRTSAAAAAACLSLSTAAVAAPVHLVVTLQNLAAANSVSFAPLHVGFHNGSFDVFNNGQTAGAAIVSVAEGGSGSAWQPAFAAADPGAVRGTIGGALFPGASTTMMFTVDPTINPFFTFASMVIPSNDLFIGNDSPTQYRLFNAAGQLLINTIDQLASDIWDAGSEVANPANAAFVVGGDNDARTPQSGVVSRSLAELLAFNGVNTPAGYVFNSTLAGTDSIYRIGFEVQNAVPEPSSWGLVLLALGGLGLMGRRRKLDGAAAD